VFVGLILANSCWQR